MRKATLIAALALVGCATQQRGPEVYEGNEVSVIVGWNHSTVGATGAMGVAQVHCAKYGKNARYSGKPNTYLLAYDCVK